MRRVKETAAEGAVCAWYDTNVQWLRTKLNLQGHRGWPDQCFWLPGGKPLLIEFKVVGEAPGPLQAHIHKLLKLAGYEVQVHTNAAVAISAINARLKRNTK